MIWQIWGLNLAKSILVCFDQSSGWQWGLPLRGNNRLKSPGGARLRSWRTPSACVCPRMFDCVYRGASCVHKERSSYRSRRSFAYISSRQRSRPGWLTGNERCHEAASFLPSSLLQPFWLSACWHRSPSDCHPHKTPPSARDDEMLPRHLAASSQGWFYF